MNNLQTSGQLTIGTMASRTGMNVSAIRYYEEVGLIPQAARRPSGHRVYGQEVEEVLMLIRHCRDLGFSIDETRALVSLSTNDERDCAEARDIAKVHLDAIRTKLAELQKLERTLSNFVQTCTDQCLGGPAPKCTILKDLSSDEAKNPGSTRCCC